MFNIFRKKKKLGVIYWVDLRDIEIQPQFLQTKIREEKYQRKKTYYLQTGVFESTVQLNRNNVLVDGYSTYLIAQEFNLGKIPVVYVA